jgi:Uma2 family endonuclease
MTAMIPTAHDGPWTEGAYLALGETAERIELWDGDLRVTASPTPWHQHVTTELLIALRSAARERNLRVHAAINLRLRPSRIVIPDLTITSAIDFHERVVPCDAAKLVCEVTSPSNASTDRVLKMHYYAEAGIPWYLMVEHVTTGLRLFRLDRDKYKLEGIAEQGEVLRLTEPVTAEIRPESLLP